MAGWVTLSTPEGQPYYFNQLTNVTQWELPPEWSQESKPSLQAELQAKFRQEEQQSAYIAYASERYQSTKLVTPEQEARKPLSVRFPGMCHDFVTKGHCARGDECTRNHDEEALATRIRESSIECHNYSVGRCMRGDECRFKHVTPEQKAKEKREAISKAAKPVVEHPVSSEPVKGSPGWLRVLTSKGRTYYTHADSQRTSWDPPPEIQQEEEPEKKRTRLY